MIWERSSRLHRTGLKIAKQFDLPYVLEWKDHLVNYKHSLFKRDAVKLENTKLIESNFIVVESNILAKLLSEEHNLPITKFVTAINAVNADYFYQPQYRDEIRESLNLASKTYVVGYVGSFAFYHNVEILCEVANKMSSKFSPKELIFLCVGDGHGRINVENKINRENLGDFFIFTGKVPKEKVPFYLSAFDCSILPDSTSIICPIKVQEYMAAGLPVLIPNYDANSEVVIDNFNGLMFEPQNSAAICRCLLMLMHDRKNSQRLGANARSTVKDNLTWNKTWGAALEKINNSLN